MNLVDSSGWLAYLSGSKNAAFFAKPLEDTKHLIVPTICIYEVFKKLYTDKDQDIALQAIAVMEKGHVVDLNSTLSIEAAKISQTNKLAMADSIIVTIARSFKATIWTQDIDFKNLPNIKYIEF